MNNRLKITLIGAAVLILLVSAIAWTGAAGQMPPAYQITSLDTPSPAWQPSGDSSGGNYILQPLSPQQNGSGCCCNHLPCMLKATP